MLTPNSSSGWHLLLFLPSVCHFCMLNNLQNSYYQDLLSVCLEVYSCDMGFLLPISPLKKLIMEWILGEKRERGHPRKTWMEGV
jgi:hypothetical protein